MFNSKKPQYGKSLSTFLCLSLLVICTSLAVAEENYGNLPPDSNMMVQESIDLPFDPNLYDFLIYVPEGEQDSIEEAMERILDRPLNQSEIRSYTNPVTSSDLATHDILIVGWNANGNVSGLDEDILSAGITGRVILSGHDADYHTVHGPPAAEVFLVQAIDHVLAGGGTGMITLGCTDGFPYLPEEWDVNALLSVGETVTEFTTEGLASGVYEGLEPEDMSNWGTSYHDVFTIDEDSVFVQFELGGDDGNDIITVARFWSGYGVELTKTDDVNDGDCVSPRDEITYTISYSYPNEPNLPNINDVNIIDYLSDDVKYLTSDPCGTYDSNLHTVTWNIGTLEPNESGSVTLTVKVNECILGCGIITNLCKIKGKIKGVDLTLGWAYENTPVCSASNPNPTCGEIVSLDVGEFDLSWCPGLFAADVNGHEVYFGSNFNDVNNADINDPNVYKGTVTNPSYPIEFNSLDIVTTYYWRIDEVNTNHPDVRWRGGVWYFTTGDYFVVENFNSYANSSALRDVWKDYRVNGSRAVINLMKETEDANLVQDGNSMWYWYGNDYTPYYAEAYADTTDLPSEIGSDWTTSGVKALVLSFYGKSDNDANELMYVALSDGSSEGVVIYGDYGEDLNDLRIEDWQQWNIDLEDFNSAGVDLTNVTRITIGFGDGSDPSPASGEGNVYFDNIRLYQRCFPRLHPDYDEWIAVGKPECWCYPRQCHGDADGLPYGFEQFWVSIPDLNIMKDAWGKTAEQLVGDEICADFDHQPYGIEQFRVSIPELDILKDNWGIPNGPDPNCFEGY